MKNIFNIVLVSIATFLLGPALTALASDLPPPVNITGGILKGWAQDLGNYLISFSIILAVIFIILSGIRWMMAQGEPKKIDEAKGMLKSGIIGAAVVLGVGVLIDTIEAVISGNFFS